MKKSFYLSLVLILFTACAQTPIRSTVDGYGEIPIQKTDPLYFVRDSLSLLEKPVADSCKDAARTSGITVSDTDCKECRQVLVRSQIIGTAEALRTTPGFNTSWGVFGPYHGGGFGYGSGSRVSTTPESGREIEVDIYQDKAMKTPVRSIVVRSVGERNSVSAVAYEMCQAAFQDYPENTKGKFYEIAPHGHNTDEVK